MALNDATEALGLPALDAAFDQAVSGADLGDDDLLTPPATGELPAEGDEGKQTETTTEKPEESIFGDLAAEVTPKSPDGVDWETKVAVKGFDEPVPLRELRDGFMRQADYTRKTQALAEDRKQFSSENENALRLYTSLAEDAVGSVAYMAVQMGLVTEADVAGKVKDLRGVWKPPPKPDELEKIIEQRVEDRLKDHPALQQATMVTAQREVDRRFDEIETKFSVSLKPQDRARILERAIQAETTDLELVFSGMMAQVERLRKGREEAKNSATNRPGTRSTTDSGKPAKINTVADAFAAALAEAAAQA
jgi:hypothetical protein